MQGLVIYNNLWLNPSRGVIRCSVNMAKFTRMEPQLFIIFIIVSVLTHYAFGMKLSPEHRKLYNNLKSGRGLYDSEDKITILNVTNFKSSVYGTKHAWVVEFYNSWCGFCHRFAPLWKALAADMYNWKDVIEVAAVDCANDDNNPLCREYEIMHYPMVKFFPANCLPGNMGIEVLKGKNLPDLRHAIVDILEKEHVDGKGISWPNITPYRSSDVSNFWTNILKAVKYTILIFEDEDSYIGTEVILDLHAIKNIQIRSVLNHNEAVSKLMGISTFPSLIAIERDMNSVTLTPADNTRESYRKAIREFLIAHKIDVPVEEMVIKDPENWVNAKVPDLMELMAEAEEEKKHDKLKELGDVVFLLDLEMTIQYSLRHEIPSHKLITGKALDALKNYLIVLAKYFPMKQSEVSFLDQIRDRVVVANSIEGQQMREYIEELNGKEWPKGIDWIGCSGSKPTLRGYPCGLWTLFHTLTVNAAIKSHQTDNPNVLDAMHGYIKYFFGCEDCSKHFQQMAAEKSLTLAATKPDKSILWLWEAHNEVNKRLAKDETEDPLHPKIQFPSKETCPSCRKSDGSWDYNNVLKHLKHMYSKENVNKMGLDFRIPDEVTSVTAESDFKVDNVQIKRLGWNFNNFDISICVTLYAFSACILAVVCYKFIMRRRYKKKLYVHDLFGKV